MGYSTTFISIQSALGKLKINGFTVDSASHAKYLGGFIKHKEITSAQESDHSHIILNLKDGGFIDCKLIRGYEAPCHECGRAEGINWDTIQATIEHIQNEY